MYFKLQFQKIPTERKFLQVNFFPGSVWGFTWFYQYVFTDLEFLPKRGISIRINHSQVLAAGKQYIYPPYYI